MAVGSQEPCLPQRALLLVRELFLVQCLVLHAVATQSHLLAILLSAWQRKPGVGMYEFYGISSLELACTGFMA